ncbi:50S ribosomal protein L30 [Fibrobacterota bacterium]
MADKIKITQIRSSVRRVQKQKATLKALGLRGIRKSVIKERSPAISGMLDVVAHLVTVEELS